ncbi:cutinase family protein [Streptomyces sp. NPDC058145]|uniref:cutinase family protein n=1 Tax=Streptomyces sp. NPDC058145 TaxID=3346356 RepID=UPI0036EA1292
MEGSFRRRIAWILGAFIILAGASGEATASVLARSGSQVAGEGCPVHFRGLPGMVGPGEKDGKSIIADTWDNFQQSRTAGMSPTSHVVEYPAMKVTELTDLARAGLTNPPEALRIAERNFNSSNVAGMARIGLDIAKTRQKCKATRFVLAGYSQGAWVIDRYLRFAKPEVLRKIDAVALYGDPQWEHDAKGRGRARILSRYFETWKLSGQYPGFKDRVQSLCASKDPICGEGYKGTDLIAQARDAQTCAQNSTCPHYLYAPTATKQGGDFLAARASPKPSAPELTDWENHTYGLTCDDTVDKPVKVAVRKGEGVAKGSSLGGYDRWEVEVQQIAHGSLPRLGSVTAVLFYCSPQPSNFSLQELRVYRSKDGSEIGRTPTFDVSGLSPRYQPKSLAIEDGRVAADVKFYGPEDSHATGPSILRHVTWTWNGTQFVTHGARS